MIEDDTRVLIIGAGVAGLSAGIHARIQGYRCTIVEKHGLAGGECTGWDRKGFHIDGCIHWLAGTREGSGLNDLWKRVGALGNVDIYEPESFMVHEHETAHVPFYRDLDLLYESWVRVAPEDSEEISSFCSLLRDFQKFTVPVGKPADIMNPLERLKSLAAMKDIGPLYMKYSKISLKDFAMRFQNPAIREALASSLPENFSAVSLLFALAAFTRGDAAIPAGGSRALAQRMLDRYLELGGEIVTNSEIRDIRIRGKAVESVVTKDGKEYVADYFLAACDARHLFDNLLGGRYKDKAFERAFSRPEQYPLASNIYISIACDRDVLNIPRCIRFPVKDLHVQGSDVDFLQLTHYAYEKDFAPEGKNIMTVVINQFGSDIDAWLGMSEDRKVYKETKTKIGLEVLRAVEKRFPEMTGQLELLDVATPLTYMRYCNAYRGAFMPFLPGVSGKMFAHNGRIRSLKNLHLTGQWLQTGGGLPTAVITGKDSIQRIAYDRKEKYSV
ncbi:FAD-dependent oxidoreductase [Spirochaeta dissipatitropha]